MNTCEKLFHNMGYKDAKNSADAVVLQARKFGFEEGWMVAVNAISLPDSSPFRDPDQIPLPDDPLVEVRAHEQPWDGGDEYGEDSLGMVELS